MPILWRNVDKKLLETEFLIAICCHIGDNWQSKTLFQSIFDPPLSIYDSIFNCRLPSVEQQSEKVTATRVDHSLVSVLASRIEKVKNCCTICIITSCFD